MNTIVIPNYLDEAMQNSDIIVFEGFEMTGKSTLAKFVEHNYEPSFLYRPDWEDLMPEEVITRGNRYIPGLCIADNWRSLLSKGLLPDNSKLLLDRWIASSLVYRKLYHQRTDCISANLLLNSFIKSVEDLHVLIVHKSHSSEQEAKIMYENSLNNSIDHEDVYDRFKDFEDYYQTYLRFEEYYSLFYRIKSNPFEVFKISSLTNSLLEEYTNASRNLL